MVMFACRGEQVCTSGSVRDAQPVSSHAVLISRTKYQLGEQPAFADSKRKSTRSESVRACVRACVRGWVGACVRAFVRTCDA